MPNIPTIYIVVENAGHNDERDVHRNSNYWNALHWLTSHYTDDEQHELHVAICRITDTGDRQYEI